MRESENEAQHNLKAEKDDDIHYYGSDSNRSLKLGAIDIGPMHVPEKQDIQQSDCLA